jgi:hypothetical protein
VTLVLLFLASGKLLIYLIQKSPYIKYINWRFLTELSECSLCLGVWVYFGLSILYKYVWFDELRYIPIFSEFLTGATASFIMWLLSEGWNSKFREYVIKD